MTNADVIRRMTDDELYEFLSEWECGDIDYAVTFCDLCKGGGNELNIDCDGCRKHWLTRNAVEYGGLFYWKRNKDFTDRKTEPTRSKMEQVDKDTNVRSKDCETCKWGDWYRNGYDITTMDDECGGCCSWNSKWTPKTEPQIIACPIQEEDADYARWLYEDEPQTDEEQFCRDHKCTFYRPQEGGCTKNTGDCPFNDEPQTDNGIGCSRCEGRYDCFDRDTPNAVNCNNYGKITDEPQTDCAWKKGK